MPQIKFTLRFVALLLFAAGAEGISFGQQSRSIKDPYTLSVQASRISSGIEIIATIRSVDPQKYPLPGSIKQFVADPEDGAKYRLQRYTADNVPLVNGEARFVLSGYDNCQDFHVHAHIKIPGWNDEHLEHHFHLPARPNLSVERIASPDEVFANTAFGVQATIRESNGDLGAAATVTLYDGLTVLASIPNISVPKGGNVTVSFPGIIIVSPGKHYLSIRISNAVPQESDLGNNSRAFVVNVLAKPDLRVERITAPDNSFANTAFEIHAYIREAGGTDTKASVSLYDGSRLIGSVSRVEVHARSLERVTFRGISPAASGQHVYTVSITNADPQESDVSNNTSAVTVRVLLRPDLRVESASVPSPIFVNTTFDLTAVIREYNGQSGATAFVALYEGKERQTAPVKVTVGAGGIATATFQNLKERTKGVRTYILKIYDVDPCESNDDNNTYSCAVTILVRPDLKVENVVKPAAIAVGVPFSIDAIVKEIDGQSGAVGTVTLFEGNEALASRPGVSVPAAGSVTVSFSGIAATSAGNHSYSIKISGAVPAESDLSNNCYSFTLAAAARPDLRIDAISAPSTAQVGAAFAVSAIVREYLGVAATASVALYEGSSLIGASQSVACTAGGSTNVVFAGNVLSTPGIHTLAVRISGSVPTEWDVTNNEQTFTVNVLPRPDLIVEQLVIPAQISANVPFDLQALIRELTGASSASASVSLYEGTTLLSGPQTISVPAGGTATALFSGIVATSPGRHSYTVVISGAAPSESDVTNNQNTSSAEVTQQSPMDLSLSYAYSRTLNIIRQSSNYGWFSLDSTYSESGSLTFTAAMTVPAPPPARISALAWTISTPAGTFDQTTLSNVGPSSSHGTTDYYSFTDVNGKGIIFSMTVERVAGIIEVSIHQQAAFSERTFITPETNLRTTSGNHANVVQPQTALTVTLTLQEGGNTWGGTKAIAVSPIVEMSSSRTVVVNWISIEDGTKLETETISLSLQAAGPEAPSQPASVAASMIAAEDDRPSPMIPLNFEMNQNYPNPFNPATTFEFALPKASFVSLKVYDMLGREVATVASHDLTAGLHRVRWNAGSLPSGMYVYRLSAGEFVAQKKLMIVK
jgi:hypothetical protein